MYLHKFQDIRTGEIMYAKSDKDYTEEQNVRHTFPKYCNDDICYLALIDTINLDSIPVI